MSAEVLRYAAFTRDGQGGNPAGVVLDADELTAEQMLDIAAEVGFSETAFASLGEGDGGYAVRYFSPMAEVAFCGHATIAMAVAMALRDGPGRLNLQTRAGTIRVLTTQVDGTTRARLTSPATHTVAVEGDVLDEALRALRWNATDIDDTYPAHVASAGNDHLLLAAATLERLADLSYDFAALQRLMLREAWTTVCLFWVDPADGSIQVRNPFPPGGVVEDPATGAAAAALGGYLRDLGFVPTPSRLTLFQGHHMGRPSQIEVEIGAAGRSVDIIGTATPMAPPDMDTSAAVFNA